MSIRLPERVGLANAKDLMFTARRIDGDAAPAIGLVDRRVPDDELDAAVDTLAGEICANSPGTNRIVKRLLRERLDRNRPDALAYERPAPTAAPRTWPSGWPARAATSELDERSQLARSADHGGDRAAAEVVERAVRRALRGARNSLNDSADSPG